MEERKQSCNPLSETMLSSAIEDDLLSGFFILSEFPVELSCIIEEDKTWMTYGRD